MKKPHQYRDLDQEALESVFSYFLIDSWSFSKVATFSRNEKAFEMAYVYRQPSRRSASEVAGSAYHEALRYFFENYKSEARPDIADLQAMVFTYIDSVPANSWKIQKTTPTIADCVAKATETTNKFLKNFFHDISVYADEIAEIHDVELYCDQFLTINGVDLPLPCHGVVDLVITTKSGKRVIIDHKSKQSYTDEKEIRFTGGRQAITYAKLYEEYSGKEVDEVWFIENKSSENRDKSPQLLCYKIALDNDTRRLYEALLYEPLKRMLDATSNPDYIYLINEADNFVDKAEIYDFWAQSMMAEVSDYNIPENKKDLITKRLKKIRDTSIAHVDPKAIKKFRQHASEFIQYDLTNKDMTKPEKIEHTLRTLNLSSKVAHTFSGYSSDTFLLEVSAGTNLSSVFKYRLDIANALNVPSVRIMKELFVYEGKSYLAIESPKTRERDLIFDKKFLQGQKIPVGVDNLNQTLYWNTESPSSPHILVCGSTGSGKSVFLICIIEYAKLAGFDDIILFDPKYEFQQLFSSKKIQTFSDIEDIETVMALQVEEMNYMIKNRNKRKTLIVFDEFADAVAAAKSGAALDEYQDVVEGTYKDGRPKIKRVKTGTRKSLEENLKILLQKGRSVGYRIIAATQRASVKVITGDAKVNFPVQVCFKVPKEIDSKVVLDEPGAESLSGKGDGLFKSPDYPGIIRFQSFYKP